jgi:hypothetical protein
VRHIVARLAKFYGEAKQAVMEFVLIVTKEDFPKLVPVAEHVEVLAPRTFDETHPSLISGICLQCLSVSSIFYNFGVGRAALSPAVRHVPQKAATGW